MAFKYQKREDSNMRKRSEQWGNSRESFLTDHVPIWRPKDGTNTIRILPPSWSDCEHYGLDIYVHYNVGADKSQFLDLTKMKKLPDPITEEVQKARAEGDEAYAKEIDSRKRVLVYLIDRDRPKDGPMLWAMPWTVDKDIALQAYDARTNEALPIDSPEDGYDVIITKAGQKDRTEYNVKLDRRSTALELDERILDALENHPLPDCLVYSTYEKIHQEFQGTVKSTASAKNAETPPPKTETRERADLSWSDIMNMTNREFDALFESLVEEGHDLPEFGDDEEAVRRAVAKALELKEPRAAPAARTTTRPKQEPAPPLPAEEFEDDVPFEQEETPAPPPKTETAATTSMKDRLAALREKSRK